MNINAIWDVVTQIFTGIGELWKWFTDPIDFLGGIAPWMICTSAGFIVLIGFWIFKLVNPFS